MNNPTTGTQVTTPSERELFEQWYVENVFDFESNPFGSRECGLQWKAWRAARATAQREPLTQAELWWALIGGHFYAKDLGYMPGTTNWASAVSAKLFAAKQAKEIEATK